MKVLASLLILSLLLTACGPSGTESAGGQAAARGTQSDPSAYYRTGSLVEDLREMPFHWPCQSDTNGEYVGGSPATYVRGPMFLIGCITDPRGKGIGRSGTEVDPSRSDATVTAAGFISGVDGRYVDPGISQPGWYTITATAYGYKPATKRVLIKEGWTTVLDYVLTPVRATPTPMGPAP